MVKCVKGKIVLFADDTILYSMEEKYDVAVSNLQMDLTTLELWTRDSQLTININKSKSMSIEPGCRRKKEKRAK